MPLGSYQEAVRQQDEERVALQALLQPTLLLIPVQQRPTSLRLCDTARRRRARCHGNPP